MKKPFILILLISILSSGLIYSQIEDTITIKHVNAYQWSYENNFMKVDSVSYDLDTVNFFYFSPYKEYKYMLTNDLVGGVSYPAYLPDLMNTTGISNIKLPYLQFVGFFDIENLPLISSDTAIMQARFMQGISREEYFQAHFTMPISDIAHFNFFYRSFAANSTYTNSSARQNQFYSTFFGNTKNKKYNYYLGILQQNRTNKENGGIQDISSFTDSAKTDRILLDVLLKNASSFHKTSDYFYSHSYNFSKSLSIFHHISYSQYSFKYEDPTPTLDFYSPNIVMLNDSVFDTLHVWQLDNKLGFNFNNNIWEVNLSYNYSIGKYKMDSIKTKPNFHTINAIISYRNLVKLDLQYYLGNYKNNKIAFSGDLPFISFEIGYKKFSQPYIYSHFLGKYYKYTNKLPDTDLLWARIGNKNKFGSISIFGGYLDNKLFFDLNGNTNFTKSIIFAGLELDLEFKLGKHFVIQSYNLLQYPFDSKTLPVP
ncbi:MAG: hypothetical protein PHF55_07515, partial [Bacteroidales bacterium]|nr:hypothetical protein [Bacteroidales bacterium]